MLNANVFLFIGTIALFFFKPENDVHWPPWLACVLMCTGFLILKLKLPKSLKFLFLFVALQSVVWCFDRALTAPKYSYEDSIALRFLALENLFKMGLLTGLTIWWDKIRPTLAWALFIGGLCQVCSLIIDQPILHIISGVAPIGLLGNRSIGASFVAVWIFFVLEWSKDFPHDFRQPIRWSLPLGVLAIGVSNSGISFVAMVVGMASYFLEVNAWGWAALGLASLFLTPYAAPRLLSSNPRFEAWPIFFDYWFGRMTRPPGESIWHSYWEGGKFSVLFGSGGGSFKVWGPTAQMSAGFMQERWFLWAHNDWLQIGLEFGVVGLGLALWVFTDALRGSRNRPALFASLISLAIVMLGNYPLEIAPTCLLAWFVLTESFLGRENRWKNLI